MDSKKTTAFWRNHIRAQQSSGFTIKAYCEVNGLYQSGFFRWRKRLRLSAPVRKKATSQSTRKSETPNFVPVPLAIETVAAPIELHLPTGVRICVPSSCLAETLAMVMSVLGLQAEGN